MRFKVALLVFIFIGSLVPMQPVAALSCMPITLEGDFIASLAVFMGNVTTARGAGKESDVKVTHSWKGPKVGTTVPVTSTDPLMWGVELKEGYTYLIFSKNVSPYHMGLCDSSRQIITQKHVDDATTAEDKAYYKDALAQEAVWMSDITAKLNVLANAVTVEGNHNPGTNVRTPDGTVYRISENKVLQPYTSAGAFLSYKFNSWARVVEANSADLQLPKSSDYIPPRNGSLINDKGTVYIITDGQRAGFTLESIFNGFSYSYANVYSGDTSFMENYRVFSFVDQKHPNGTLINDKGTLYIMQHGFRVGIPSMAVLDSWGYWVNEAVPANTYDLQAEVSSVLQPRMANQMSI